MTCNPTNLQSYITINHQDNIHIMYFPK